MSLQEWMTMGIIEEHESSPQEIGELLDVVRADQSDARLVALGPDRRLSCCYGAILTPARATLRASGYRVRKGVPSHHHYAIQSLQRTAGFDSLTLRKIESLGKKRVTAEYVRVGEVSASMVDDAIELAEACCQQVEDWIHVAHPDLARA